MDVSISTEAAMLTNLPAAGDVRFFINTDKNNVLYYVNSSGQFFVYSANNSAAVLDSCTCELAKNWLESVTCAMKKGLIEVADFQSLIDSGLVVNSVSQTNPDTGVITNTVTIGTNSTQPLPLTITLDPVSPLAIAVLGTQIEVATVLPANASQDVIWVTSNPAIATVTQAGLVTGIAVGSAIITVYSAVKPSITATLTVNVS